MARILLRYVSRANPTADRCAQFFRGAAALECGGLTPLWEQRLLPPGNPPRNDVQDRSAPAKLQKMLRNNSDQTCYSPLIAGTMPAMKTFTSLITILFATVIATSSFAQSPATSPATATGSSAAQPASATGQLPNPQEMMKQMMEMSKLNENHKLLSEMNGNWNFAIKMWMNPDPNAKPQESKGTATRKDIMGGRYVMMDVTGKMQMPGADGKMKDVQFKGMGVEGYDNAKKKFVSSWIDNMGTGIQFSEGTYDPATKTFTYTSEIEMMPGMKTPVREVIKVARQQPYGSGMVRKPWRPGKENHGNRLHTRRQEVIRNGGKLRRQLR